MQGTGVPAALLAAEQLSFEPHHQQDEAGGPKDESILP